MGCVHTLLTSPCMSTPLLESEPCDRVIGKGQTGSWDPATVETDTTLRSVALVRWRRCHRFAACECIC